MKTIRLTTAKPWSATSWPSASRSTATSSPPVPGGVRHLRPRQRDLSRSRLGGGQGRPSPPGEARTNRAWRWPRSPTPRPSVAARSWSRPARSARARPTWSRRPAVAHANRLPVLLLAGDTFASRMPDPVLQQVEHFADPSVTVNDSFKAVTRYWDRIVRPEQLVHSLPHAVATMLDPATCGPAFLALPQDVQAEAYDYPDALLRAVPPPDPPASTRPGAARRRRRGAGRGDQAADHRRRRRPLLPSRGRSCGPSPRGTTSPSWRRWPGKASLLSAHPLNAGPIGSTGCTSANALAAEADVVLAVGTRLQDFTTGSWTVFRERGGAAHRPQHGDLRRGQAPRAAARRPTPGRGCSS